MRDRCVLVTGGASGIGRATVLAAARRGARVGVLDRDGDGARSVAREAGAAGAGDALALPCDVTSEDDVARAVAATVERLGTPHGVVTSAGISPVRGPAHELPLEVFDATLSINLRGTFATCKQALAAMVAAGRGGSVVCISSPLGSIGFPGGTDAYSASKGGVSALVRSLAVQYAAYGIRINGVLPGPTETPLMWSDAEPEAIPGLRELVRSEVPLGRLAEPDEIAAAAVWLLSDDASYVTGSHVTCDGGVLARSSLSI